MSLLTIAFILLFYAATAILVIGIGYRIKLYASTPTPLRIPTTPAPLTRPGVVRRMFFEVVLFNSLFKANKWIWLFGWVFHAALLFVLLRHLRYFTDPVWSWVSLIQPIGAYAAFAMVLGLAGLWARRFLVDREDRIEEQEEPELDPLIRDVEHDVRKLWKGLDRPWCRAVVKRRRARGLATRSGEQCEHGCGRNGPQHG